MREGASAGRGPPLLLLPLPVDWPRGEPPVALFRLPYDDFREPSPPPTPPPPGWSSPNVDCGREVDLGTAYLGPFPPPFSPTLEASESDSALALDLTVEGGRRP
jgi:hypothetical protein